jgi:hypothetical protein
MSALQTTKATDPEQSEARIEREVSSAQHIRMIRISSRLTARESSSTKGVVSVRKVVV